MNNKQMIRTILCWASGQPFALKMDKVRSIQRMEQLTVDENENGRIGWVSVGQTQVPVYTLATQLDLEAEINHVGQRIIILSDSIGAWALLVERVSQVVELPTDRLHALPDSLGAFAHTRFQNIIRQDDGLLLLLDTDGLHPDTPAFPIPDWLEQPPLIPMPEVVQSTKMNQRMRQGQIVTFKLPLSAHHESDFTFALSVTQVAEVLEPLPVLPVPGMPDYLSGLVKWRNQPLPVMDLACRLELGKSQLGQSRLLISRLGQQTWMGIWVQTTVNILTLPLATATKVQKPPINPDWVHGCVSTGDDLLLIPRLSKL